MLQKSPLRSLGTNQRCPMNAANRALTKLGTWGSTRSSAPGAQPEPNRPPSHQNSNRRGLADSACTEAQTQGRDAPTYAYTNRTRYRVCRHPRIDISKHREDISKHREIAHDERMAFCPTCGVDPDD